MFNLKFCTFLLYFLAFKVTALQTNHVQKPPFHNFYEFWLTVNYRLTMSAWDDDMAPPIYLNLTGNQKFYLRSNDAANGCTDYQEFKGDFSKIIIGDGRHRDVIAVNDSIPAPSLVVYSGSTIIVLEVDFQAARLLSIGFLQLAEVSRVETTPLKIPFLAN